MVFGSEPIRGGPLIESGYISGGLEKWILERPRQRPLVTGTFGQDVSLISGQGVTAGHS